MPELPEVAALAAALDRELRGRTVESVLMRSVSALKTFDPPVSALQGLAVSAVTRRGKFIDIELPPLHLVVHLARAGWLRRRTDAGAGKPSSLRGPLLMTLRFDDGSALDATEQGTEKRFAVYVVRTPGDVPGIARLGIDAMDPALTAERLGALLRTSGGTLKSVLADQDVIAGVGNAYSDEVLHAARLSPFRKAASLDSAEIAALHTALREVLSDAMARAASVDPASLRGDKKLRMRVHGRTGETCPVCGETIRQVAFSSRSLQLLPHLPDRRPRVRGSSLEPFAALSFTTLDIPFSILDWTEAVRRSTVGDTPPRYRKRRYVQSQTPAGRLG